MSLTTSTHPTLASQFWPKGGIAKAVLITIVGSLLLTATAKVKVPFWPVEMTMQTFAVIVIGMTCGWRLGMATVGLYLAQGALGLPVFTGTPEKGIGLVYMAGPTGGYLLGFLLSAGLVGWLAERGFDRNIGLAAFTIFAGLVVLYVPGIIHLGNLFGWDKPVLEWGLYPFLAGEGFKMALAAAVLPLAWRVVGDAPKG
tara:strand:+ start:104338 stop:104934 length:597 start_codon:yes stop_codon:yes gene_type:complete